MANRYDRQTFLGSHAQATFEESVIGIVGLGGGGSHVVQQLGHLGITHFTLFDPDTVEESNLNRLIGAQAADVSEQLPKVRVAQRVLHGINPAAMALCHQQRWETAVDDLKQCDVIVSCVDSFAARQDIEANCRRYLMPVVDIGMDVAIVGGAPHIAGQVILSLPGGPCLKCLGFLTAANLTREAEQYGAAGHRPQVVWANGVLASIAVGLVVDLLTGWSHTERRAEYLHFDGNTNLVTRSPRLDFAPAVCPHFPATNVGDPIFR